MICFFAMHRLRNFVVAGIGFNILSKGIIWHFEHRDITKVATVVVCRWVVAKLTCCKSKICSRSKSCANFCSLEICGGSIGWRIAIKIYLNMRYTILSTTVAGKLFKNLFCLWIVGYVINY